MDRIRGFDGLRALALTAVFLQHYTRPGRDLELGGYGVWLFFALSGFLIVRILHTQRERVEAGAATVWSALRRFFWRRTLRIFPIYYLVLALFTGLGALMWVKDWWWPAAPWHYAYLSNFYFAVEGRWVGRFGPFWSLAIEEQFYLFAAPAILFAPSRWTKGICIAVVIAALACDLTLRSSGATAMWLYVNPLTNFGMLALGGWAALGQPLRPRDGTRSWGVLTILAVIVFLVGFSRLGAFRPAVSSLLAGAPFWSTAILATATLVLVYRNQRSTLVKVLEWGPIAYWGRISYGFYLYHNLLPHNLLAPLLRTLGLSWRTGEISEALFSFGLGFALAALSWRLIERPLLGFKDRPPNLRVPKALFRGRAAAPQPARAEG